MRILFTSDLHYPITSFNALENLISKMKQENSDIVVIAGDIAENFNDHNFNNLSSVLKLFKDNFKQVLVLAGNHDLWANKTTSLDIWNYKFQEIVESCDCIYLEKQNFVINNIAIVGSYLHYDYSAKNAVSAIKYYSNSYFKINKYKYNNDANYLKIDDDIEFANTIVKDFQLRMNKATEDVSVKKILVTTHVPCHEGQVHITNDYNWIIGTPYFANLSVKDSLMNNPKITHIISGHSHIKKDFEIQDKKIHVIGSEYRKPVYLGIEV